MKIIIKNRCILGGGHGVGLVGKTYDLPDGLARGLINAGQARPKAPAKKRKPRKTENE